VIRLSAKFRTISTKVMREEVAENSTWRPSSLKLPPASSSSSVSTKVFCARKDGDVTEGERD
jgi:hypothetical protein